MTTDKRERATLDALYVALREQEGRLADGPDVDPGDLTMGMPELADAREMIDALRAESDLGHDVAMIAASLAGEALDMLEGVLDELDRITNARTRANVERGQRRRADVALMREDGEKVSYIALTLGVSERYVTALSPEHLKRRR